MKAVRTDRSMAGLTAFRRETSLTAAALLMINGVFGGLAAVMSGSGPAEADQGGEEDETAPTGGVKPLDMSAAMPRLQASSSGGPKPLAAAQDDGAAIESSDVPVYSTGAAASLVGSDASFYGGDYDAASGARLSGARPHLSSAPAVAGASGSSAGADGGAKEIDHSVDTEIDGIPMTLRIGTDDDDVMLGGATADYMFGRDGDDVLSGGGGNDRILGGKGDDILLGGAGNDMIVGDKGDDTMSGGSGADTFVFKSGFGHDTITDFNVSEHDVVEIIGGEFADFAAMLGSLADTDAGVVITLQDGSTLTLSHVLKANLRASDFHFEP